MMSRGYKWPVTLFILTYASFPHLSDTPLRLSSAPFPSPLKALSGQRSGKGGGGGSGRSDQHKSALTVINETPPTVVLMLRENQTNENEGVRQTQRIVMC